MRRLLFILCLFAIVYPYYSINSLNAKAVIQYRTQLLKSKAKASADYVKQKGMNETHALLVDLGKHSGLHRFYVWSFEKNAAIDSGLVSHGCGNYPWATTYTASAPVFSNVPDSHTSSLGRYRIGKRGYSQWGIHVNYQLHGLDATNSKALSREIVLHSWESVSEQRVYPAGTPEGWGCPAVSNGFMQRVDKLLKNAEKPLLMWVYAD